MRLGADRPWDKRAGGDAPAPVKAKFERCLFRGAQVVLSIGGRDLAELDGLQAEIEFADCLAAGPGSLVQVAHTRAAKYAHERLSLDVSDCTLDLGGPVVEIDCGASAEAPVRLEVGLNRSIVTAPPEASRPWQVLLLGSGAGQFASAAITWTGSGNAYFLRGDCLATRAAFGQSAPVLVSTPDDWAAQGFGQETGWWTGPADPKRGAWHERKASDYEDLRSDAGKGMGLRSKADRPGADRARLPVPRALK